MEQPQINKIILNLSDNEIRRFVLNKSETDENFRDELLLRFADDGDEDKYARSLIQRYVAEAMHHGTFVDCEHAHIAVEGAWAVLEIAKELQAERVITRTKLFAVVIEEMINVVENGNTNGDVEAFIDQAIEGIRDAVKRLPENPSDKNTLRDVILAHAQSSCYDGWENWRGEVLAAIKNL